jgi:hypothetical protein
MKEMRSLPLKHRSKILERSEQPPIKKKGQNMTKFKSQTK